MFKIRAEGQWIWIFGMATAGVLLMLMGITVLWETGRLARDGVGANATIHRSVLRDTRQGQ